MQFNKIKWTKEKVIRGESSLSVRIVRPDKHHPVFYAKWLSNVAHAQKFLTEIRADDHAMRTAFRRADMATELDFGLTAFELLSKLLVQKETRCEASSQQAEVVAVLVGLGLLANRRAGWTPALCRSIRRRDVAAAIRALINTEDDGCMLHPEDILATAA